MTSVATFDILRAGPRFGAEITGVDLTAPVDEATADALRQAFRDHKVLVFRGRHLTPGQHVAAVRIFAEPFDHPTAVKDPADPLVYPYNVQQTGKASTWHIGGLWRDPVFAIESLTYEVVPELGGHTLWADLQAAYDDLSAPFKHLLESVSAVYDGNAENYAQGSGKTASGPTIEHPAVPSAVLPLTCAVQTLGSRSRPTRRRSCITHRPRRRESPAASCRWRSASRQRSASVRSRRCTWVPRRCRREETALASRTCSPRVSAPGSSRWPWCFHACAGPRPVHLRCPPRRTQRHRTT